MELTELPRTVQEPPQRFLEGDKIIITNPFFVNRVGYPLSFTDAYEEVKQLYGEQLKTFLDTTIYGIKPAPRSRLLRGLSLELDMEHRDIKRILRGMTLLYMEQKGYGGTERSIHTYELANMQGQVYTVIGKKVCKTGIYDAPYGYKDHNGEYEYYPGGLTNCKTHVLLELNGFVSMSAVDWSQFPGLWIESKNVRKYAESD